MHNEKQKGVRDKVSRHSTYQQSRIERWCAVTLYYLMGDRPYLDHIKAWYCPDAVANITALDEVQQRYDIHFF